MKSAESLSLSEEEICRPTLPQIKWDTVNKFTSEVQNKILSSQGHDGRSSFDIKENLKKPPKLSITMRLKESKLQIAENLLNTKKSLFSVNKSETIKMKRLNSKCQSSILKGSIVKSWLEKDRKKRSMKKFDFLKEQQLALFGDNACLKDKKLKSHDKSHLYDSFELLIRRTIRKILRFDFIKNSIPVIHPEGRFKLCWNIFICLCILYQFFTITIELFFDSNWDRVDDTLRVFCYYVSEILKYLILLDVLMNMITGYFHRGGVVMDSYKIFHNYIQKLLLIDFLVIFPIFFTFDDSNEEILHSSALYNSKLSIIKMLFIFRLLKLKRTYYYIEQILSNNEKIEGLLALIELCFKILFTAHLFACIWYFIGDYCIRNKDRSWMDTIFRECLNCDWRTHYLYSLYWSITTMITVGYGDITPTNTIEVAFAVCSMIFGCGLFGYSLSNIGLIFEKLFAQDNELKSNVRVINRFMRRKHIDFELQGKVRRYLDYILRETGEENSEKEQDLINKLSLALKNELLLQANGSILMNSSILKNNFSQKTIQKLTEVMTPVNLAPEELIYEEESPDAEHLFFVSKGRVDLFIFCENNTNESFQKLKSLKEGDVFGELSFFTGRPREMSAVSVGYTKLYSIKKTDFINVLYEEAEDYEKFCEIRDNILFYNNLSQTFIDCSSCGEYDHNVLNCPCLKLILDRDFVVRRYLFKKRNKRRRFLRKEKRSKNSLTRLSDLSRARAELEENYDLSEYEDELEKVREDCSKLYPELNSPELASNNSYHDKSRASQSQNYTRLGSFEQPFHFDDYSNSIVSEPAPPSQDKKSNRPRNKLSKLSLIPIKNDISMASELLDSPFRRKRPTDKPSSNQTHQFSINSSQFSKITAKTMNKSFHTQMTHRESHGAPKILNLFDFTFDEAKSFKNYFPRNNREIVVMKLKSKGESRKEWEDRWKNNIIKAILTSVISSRTVMSPTRRRMKIARLNSKKMM